MKSVALIITFTQINVADKPTEKHFANDQVHLMAQDTKHFFYSLFSVFFRFIAKR
jgi:hypothetical protein